MNNIMEIIKDDDLNRFSLTFSPLTYINQNNYGNGDTLWHLIGRFNAHKILNHCISESFVIRVSAVNNDGKTSLHEASQSGSLECARLLIQCGADIDALKRGDWTPLMLASTKCNIRMCELLISNGADVRLINKDHWNSFHIAIREGHMPIIKYLYQHSLSKDKNIATIMSKNGRTPLHTAALNGHYAAVDFLLSVCHVNVNALDSCGVTPLMDAMCADSVDICKLLISFGAYHKKVDKLKKNLLHFASQSGAVNCVNYAIKCLNFDINSRCKYGRTPLHYAAAEGHREIVSLLCDEFNADITIEDYEGRTPLCIVKDIKRQAIVKYLQ